MYASSAQRQSMIRGGSVFFYPCLHCTQKQYSCNLAGICDTQIPQPAIKPSEQLHPFLSSNRPRFWPSTDFMVVLQLTRELDSLGRVSRKSWTARLLVMKADTCSSGIKQGTSRSSHGINGTLWRKTLVSFSLLRCDSWKVPARSTRTKRSC
jgi:hypothetical protein